MAESCGHIGIFVVPSGLERHFRILVSGTGEKQVNGPYLDCQQTLTWRNNARDYPYRGDGRGTVFVDIQLVRAGLSWSARPRSRVGVRGLQLKLAISRTKLPCVSKKS